MNNYIVGKFAILDIAPTNNVYEVKKAYAKKIKKNHPEENPEEWEKIHDAYIIILDYLKNNSVDESEDMDLENDSKEKAKKIFIEKIIESSEDESDEDAQETNNSDDELIDSLYANNLFDVEKEKYAKYKCIISKIKDIVLTDILVNNKHVITLESFMQLRDDELYEDALCYANFLSKLTATFEKTIIDPRIYNIVKRDILKTINTAYRGDLQPQYDRLLKVLEKNSGDASFSDAIRKAKSSIENESIRLKNAESSKFEKTIWIIGILTSIVMIIMHSRTKNGPRSRR